MEYITLISQCSIYKGACLIWYPEFCLTPYTFPSHSLSLFLVFTRILFPFLSFLCRCESTAMVQSYGYSPGAGTIVSRAVAAAAANNHHSSKKAGRTSKRYSVSAFYSMAAEQDNEVEDELAQGKSTWPCGTLNGTSCTYIPPYSDSSKEATRPQDKNLGSVEKELCIGAWCSLSRFTYCFIDPESYCIERGQYLCGMVWIGGRWIWDCLYSQKCVCVWVYNMVVNMIQIS